MQTQQLQYLLSESGTNIAVIRGIVKSSAIGAGIFLYNYKYQQKMVLQQ